MAWVWRLFFNSNTGAPSFTSNDDDIIILVVGPTGAGKSTFIRTYTGNESIAIGSTTESCTTKVTPYEAIIPDEYATKLAGRRLILVDTPGFDDTHLSDVEVLERVAGWLEKSYKEREYIAGIIYVHDITLNRMYGSSKLNLKMFSELCGNDSFNRVAIMTTRWQDVTNRGDLENREDEMKRNWWKGLLDGGAHVMRAESNTRETATAIIERCLRDFEHKQRAHNGLQIQKEMVDLSRSIPETKAGRELKSNLDEVAKVLERRTTSNLGEEELKKLKEKLKKVKEGTEILELSLGRRLRIFLAELLL